MFNNWATSTLPSDIAKSINLLNTQPNMMLQVGPTPATRYMAHSAVLAMHSGYLRSVMRLDENGIPNTTLPIFLSNVMPEQFSPLFIYMYTGYLDLNFENVFSILLATHVLHMPQASEICRNYLSHFQSPENLSQNFLVQDAENRANNKISSSRRVKIIRPIASKPSIYNIRFAVPPIPYVPLTSNDTSFHTFNNECFKESIVSDAVSNSFGHNNSCSSVINANCKAFNSTPISFEKFKKTVNCENATFAHKHYESDKKIITDVASCDGPVKFKRVLNDAYRKVVHWESNIQYSQKKVPKSFHQQMAKKILQKNVNKSNNLVPKEISSDNVFNCVYCKHAFKSQYCYQKHIKRHLNPVTLSNVPTEMVLNMQQIPTTPKDFQREVRPLDMNVQYYPCKKCGSKFPSYYFVHKHRKLCHNKQECVQ